MTCENQTNVKYQSYYYLCATPLKLQNNRDKKAKLVTKKPDNNSPIIAHNNQQRKKYNNQLKPTH